MLRLGLLGPPTVTGGGRPLTFDTRKAVALLAVLAVEQQPQPRDRLAALLWPDADPSRARSALRRTVSVTAAQVGDALVAERANLSLADGSWWCDAVEFHGLAMRREAGADAAAIELYRDDFLVGFALRDAPGFDDWQAGVADDLRRLLATVLARRADRLVGDGDLDAAMSAAQRWLSLDPLHEPAHQLLMRLHAWRGDRAGAIRQYRACARTLDAELGVEPLDETRELYDAVRRDAMPPPEMRPAGPPDGVTATRTTGRLVGRDTEIAVLRQAMSAVRDDRGSTVVVTGTTGSGKTELLRLASTLAGDDVTTVGVRCHPEETVLAYGVAIELLRSLLVAVPDSLSALPRHSRAELARLLPEIADLDGPAPGEDPGAEARLVAAARDLVVAAGRPLLLLVDDAQWLDPATANLFAYLVRRLAGISAVLVCAWSTDVGSPSPLVRAVEDAVADGSGARMALRPLSHDDIAELVDDAVDVERLAAVTGGVPALVVAYVDAARRGEDPATGAAAVVKQTVLRQIDGVSETARQLLAAVAVLGGHSDLDLLRETSGRGDDEVAAAVEEALAAGVLAELPGRDGYDVPYETMRSVVIDSTTTVRRKLLHDRAARALTRRAGSRLTPADCGAIARHLGAAGRTGEAAEWHWRAAHEARRLHAHAEALVDVRAARELGHAPVEARLAEGEVLIALGRYDDAISALELAAAGSDSASSTMQVERRLGEVHGRLGEHVVADAHLSAAAEAAQLAVAADADLAADLASVLAEQALATYRTGNPTRATELAKQAADIAQKCDDAVARATTANVLGVLAGRQGDHVAAERWFRSSLEQADRAGDATAAIAALNNLARLLHETGRTDDARGAAEDALGRGLRVGDRHRVAALHTNLADLLRASSDDEAAMAHLKQAAALFAEVDGASERRPDIWKYVEW
ncbi:MAG TPA: AAA family ATPase [Mycobacteriales bacterium]|nr:AAA family ATPase [Mycobacteriales bacterium]